MNNENQVKNEQPLNTSKIKAIPTETQVSGEQSNSDVQINTINIDENNSIEVKEFVDDRYKLSGTVNEEDIKLEKDKPKDEILDEHAIKRDVQISDDKFKYNMIYMIVFALIVLLFIFLMPYIIKIVGM